MTEHCPNLPARFSICALIVFCFILMGAAHYGDHRTAKQKFKECVGEQIQVARENWDTVKMVDGDAELAAQDQLRDFITEVCYADRES